ncbi:MAG: hypothetical protein QM723_10070 [Myxococcaceae bacterium]
MFTFLDVSSANPLAQACGPVNVLAGEATADVTLNLPCPGRYGFYSPISGRADGGGMVVELDVAP